MREHLPARTTPAKNMPCIRTCCYPYNSFINGLVKGPGIDNAGHDDTGWRFACHRCGKHPSAKSTHHVAQSSMMAGCPSGGMSVGSPFRILRVAAKVLFVRRISCKSHSIHQFWHDISWPHEGLICPVAADVVKLNFALSSNITCKHVEMILILITICRFTYKLKCLLACFALQASLTASSLLTCMILGKRLANHRHFAFPLVYTFASKPEEVLLPYPHCLRIPDERTDFVWENASMHCEIAACPSAHTLHL